jgi:DNA-binding MarR family transcriptional regulator/GNAT superfamily N-acetyltransferase
MVDYKPSIAAVRHFNRFYTKRIGVLHEGLLESSFSLTEGRVLYELAHHDKINASELGRELDLDAGYLSRILRGFRRRRLIHAQPSSGDGRQSLLSLTKTGERAFAALDSRSQKQVADELRNLSASELRQLLGGMRAIERALGRGPALRSPYLLRPHQPGDMGWVVYRHGVLYAEEYGWDERFEALVARIVAGFIENYEPRRERCWIAERDQEIVGSVLCSKRSKWVAQLRLLLVEPAARGLGIGRRLVDECVRFARRSGYKTITLWTQSNLDSARHIYKEAGFRRVRRERHKSFGADLIAETWVLKL